MQLSAGDILGMKEPGALFTGNADTMKTEYTQLAKLWHPDRSASSEADAVMTHINLLYRQALDMLQAGRWEKPGLIGLTDKDGRTHELRFRIKHNFELGAMYIDSGILAYLLDDTHRDLFENAQKVIKGFTYANDKMEREVSRYLPQVLDTFETKDHRLCLVIEKSADLILLQDVMAFYQGRIPDRHVAWILSTLYNLACYLDYAGLSHNGIALNSYLISPQQHSGALLGGWWYAVPQGSKLLGMSAAAYAMAPPEVKNEKRGSITTDLESIRFIGRALLGDGNGTKLHAMNAAPSPMIGWLRSATSSGALADYSTWREVLEQSFGPRKFVAMDVTADRIYSDCGV